MKIRKELWFGFILMALIIAGTGVMLLSASKLETGHLGLMMLALVVVAIMLGFPTAFTLMGMGMIFTWLAYDRDGGKTLTLMVQSAFKVMGNDVLISIPLFVFMGYLVERANLIDKLFKSLHLALARVPGSLAVATLFTCAVFATATGIVGAVVTLMGLLAFPQMLRGGYDVRVSAGAITAGGCLGILIPPSVMLIVYGATAGVSVVQLYAGRVFPRPDAGRAVHPLRDHPGQAQAAPDAAAVGRSALRAAAAGHRGCVQRCVEHRRASLAARTRPTRPRCAQRATCGASSA